MKSAQKASLSTQTKLTPFLLVEEPKTPNDDKNDLKMVRVPKLLANRSGGKGKTGLTHLRTRLVISGSVASAANTALTGVINIDPSGSSEWASFQALFDEVKVRGGVMHFHCATAGGSPSDIDCAIAYDPLNGGAYGSVAAVLVADQHLLFRGTVPALTTIIESPQPYNKTGFWSFKFKCPNGASKIASATAADVEVCTGEWADTNNSATPKYGFIKSYGSSGGASVVFALYYYIVLDVEFRSRS